MLRKTLIAGYAIAWLLVAPTAQAGHDGYWSEPQVRLGVDFIWGGNFGYAPRPYRGYGAYAPPPRYWHPGGYVEHRHYYPPPRGYWRPPGRGHWKDRGRRDDHRHHHDHRGRGGRDR